jgi:hypothetical protein
MSGILGFFQGIRDRITGTAQTAKDAMPLPALATEKASSELGLPPPPPGTTVTGGRRYRKTRRGTKKSHTRRHKRA